MNAITIHPANKDQEKVIKLFLDALHVRYGTQEDETKHLLSTEANKEHLSRSIRQAKEGDVKTTSLDEIWK